MAQICVTVPDAQAARVRDALALKWGFDPLAGITKMQFVVRYLANFIKNEVRDQELGELVRIAGESVVAGYTDPTVTE